MSHEQAFEQQGEQNLPSSVRQWQASELREPDLEAMLDQHTVMTGVNQRLTEHRLQPLRRTVGDIAAWSAATLLSLVFLDTHNGYNSAVPPMLIALWLYNRNLHLLDKARAALTLQEYDMRWIGPLFEALSWPNRRIRAIVQLKLLNLLPMFTENDARHLNQNHLKAIHRALEETRNSTFKLAILKAILRFGDSTSVAVVEKLTTAHIWTPAEYFVRRAALICLPLLRERVVRQVDVGAQLPAVLSPAVPIAVPTENRVEIEAREGDRSLKPRSDAEKSAVAKLEAERRKVARPSMRAAFLVADWLCIVPFTAYQAVSSFAAHQPIAAAVWTACAVGATQLYRVSLSSKRVAMMRKQAQQRDIKAVGLLAEALAWPEQDLQYEAASALTVLLPLLKANHAFLLNSAQRECLHRLLTLPNARSQTDLIVAILRAFQQVGDTAAIPYVEQLAGATPRSAHEIRVVLEAKECLPYLMLCAGNNSASHSLLRASAMTDLPTMDSLLRPVFGNPETKPEQLLRPGDIDRG